MQKLIFFVLLCIIATSLQAQKDAITIKNGHPESDCLYNFLPTRGSDYCNEDSILATDCGDGAIYISSTNNVIFYPHCIGDDTINFYWGISSSKGDTLICSFSKKYDFYIPSLYPPPTNADSNSGTIETIPIFNIQLVKLNCSNHKEYDIQYHFEDAIVFLASEEDKVSFKKSLSEIHALKKFLK